MTHKISVETKGHLLLIGVNRADKRNAFDVDMYCDLGIAYGELHRNASLRCGVLFAHGDHFTAGLDLPLWAPFFNEGRFPELPEGALHPLGLDEANRLRKPLVMAVQGICFTIGLELLLATDIRVAANDLRLGQIEIKRGIYPVGGGTIRLLQEIGWGNAMRYLLTADEMTATEAYRLGLVQEITPPGQQLERAIHLAETIAAQAPLGVQATLASARCARTQGDITAIARLLPDLMPIMRSEDVKEGLKSFIERRAANFQGR
ncbi:MAG: enoyl-CoA hydratase [Beggiatoa sp. IS2]|nr:MAG: enoyl-CoA hydratase [Beggiatoa sp. IS2]